jgi:uncharacterized cupredoxin-like copper-binding protein
MQSHVTTKALAIMILGGTFFLGACSSGSSSGARSPDNAVVNVAEGEWRMTPSMTSMNGSKVSFVVVNKGKEDHEMVLLKTDKKAGALPVESTGKVDETATGDNVGEVELKAGTTGAATFNLEPGHYVMICNLTGHYKQGMSADFTVTGSAAAQTSNKPAAPAAAAPTTAAPAAPTTAAPAGRKDIVLFTAVRPYLVKTLDAAQAGDMAAASKAQHQYDIEWHGVETYLNVRSLQLYGQLETDIQARLIKLLDDPKSSQADVIATTKELLAKYDECIKAIQSAPAISPIFDDLATIRTLKAETINEVAPVLKAGDVATAKQLFIQFMTRWADVEDTVKAYSTDAYAGIEGSTAKANTAFQKSNPSAAELTPLVADTLAQYNFAQSLITAAAKGADVNQSTFTADQVKQAADVATIQIKLQTSLTAWKAGKYQDAAAQAQLAGGASFDAVSGALKAKGGADAALKKALDAYTAVAGAAGDATTVQAAQTAAVQAAAVAQQVLAGQFWTNPKFKDAYQVALKK